MTTVLITGANRGLGLEFVTQYLAAGATIHATCREPARAEALAALAKSHPGKLTLHALDVTDANATSALKSALGATPLDIVIANAGIYGPSNQGWDTMDFDAWAQVFAANTMAPLRIAQAVHANLKSGARKTFVAITSQMGSNAGSGSGALAYRSSKAALNKIVSAMALDWKSDSLIAVAMHPGWVQTDMGGKNATLTPRDSIAAMRRTIDGLTLAGSGAFLNYDGASLPW
jgi:NAD(P)-dependent dehydrogenase (short-subunit alcohol dehydrogenase family)